MMGDTRQEHDMGGVRVRAHILVKFTCSHCGLESPAMDPGDAVLYDRAHPIFCPGRSTWERWWALLRA